MPLAFKASFLSFFILFVVASLSLPTVLPPAFGIPPRARAQDQKPLVAVIPPDFPPTYFRDPVSGKPAGLAVDLTNEIARRAGVQVEYRFDEPWENIEQQLLTGKADLIPLRVINDQTQQRFIFTHKLDATPVNYILRASDHTITGPAPGKKVGLIRGSTAEQHLKVRQDVKVVPYESMQQLFMDLITGDIDLVLTVPANLLQLARAAGLDDRVRVILPPVFEVTRGIALSPTNIALRDLLNRAIDALEGTPAQQEIYQRWLGKPPPWWTVPRLAWILSTCLAGIAILLLIWHYVGIRRLNWRLAAERRFLQTMIDAIPEPIFFKDRQGVYRGCNDFLATTVLGLNKAQIIGRTDLDLFQDRQQAELYRQRDQEVLATALPGSHDEWVTLVDGRSILMETIKVPFRDEKGAIGGVIGIARDVTAREQKERLQTEARERLQTILDNLPMMAWLKDGNRRYEMVNELFAKSLQLNVSEVIGKTDQELWPRHAEAFRAEDEQVSETRRRKQFETQLPLGSEPHWFLVFKTPILDTQGEVTGTTGIALDITERKRLVASLRESEERLQLALRGADLGMWDWNIETGAIVINQRWASMLGYAPEEIDLHVRSWEKLVHPEDLPHVQDVLHAHLAGRRAFYETEHRLLAKSGEWVWVLDKGKVTHRDGQGRPLRAVGTHLDITARKQAEAALRESEANFRTFFDSMNDMIIVAAPDGRILFNNSAYTQTLGYSAAELAAMQISDLHPADSRREAEAIFAAMLKGERKDCPLPLRRKDGSLVPVETRIWFGHWYGADCIFGISKNLTAELEAQQRFERLFRHNPNPMALTNLPHQQFMDVNDAFLKVLGYSRADVIGKTAAALDLFVHPEAHVAAGKKLLAEGHLTDWELDIRRQDGAILYGLFSGEIIRSQGRQYFLTVMLDITHRKHLEEKTKASLAEKEVLLREIHHRVKNNLQIVMGLLNSRARTMQDLRLKEILQDCQTRIHAMSLVHEILYRSSDLAHINLNQYLRSLGHATMSSYGSNRRITFLADINPIQTNIDTAIPCGLILNELISNALKHAFPDDRPGEIRLSVRKNSADAIVLTIKDDGVGIPPAIDLATVDSLGLRLVTDLVEFQLGGQIALNSNNGTEIHIVFPEVPYRQEVSS